MIDPSTSDISPNCLSKDKGLIVINSIGDDNKNNIIFGEWTLVSLPVFTFLSRSKGKKYEYEHLIYGIEASGMNGWVMLLGIIFLIGCIQ